MQTRARRLDLDCAKGLGIALVVLGHLVSSSSASPQGNLWYEFLRGGLYEFHMPFFMYLSGYVTFLSGAATTARDRWPLLVRKRAVRLLLPFVIFGLLLVAGKWLAAQVVHVDNMPGPVPQALLGLVWNTDNSPALSVWYVAVLFVFCVLTPALLWVTGNRLWPVLMLAALLYVLPIPHVLYLNRVADYYVFFLLGGLAARHEAAWLSWMDRYALPLFGVFLALVVFQMSPAATPIPWHARVFVAGVVSMPALHGMVRRRFLSESRLLLFLGVFSFVIYLFNTPCIGLLKGLMLKFIPWDGVNFLLYAPLLMAFGTFGPILIKKYLLRPFPAIDRITD